MPTVIKVHPCQMQLLDLFIRNILWNNYISLEISRLWAFKWTKKENKLEKRSFPGSFQKLYKTIIASAIL